jgi:hypothetical protein
MRTRTGTMCLHWHFSYPDSIRTRARRFLRCIPSQVCFEPLTHTHTQSRSSRSSKHNHISRYTSTGRRLPARPPLGESLDIPFKPFKQA